jgi:acetyltransferase-like isoleucine patch superfamily enzyme
MKIDYRDVVFTSLGLLFTLGLTLAAMGLAAPFLERLSGRLYPLAYAIAFLLAYGVIAASYLRLLTHLYPFQEGVYPFEHAQFTLWKHCAMIGELSKTALGPLNLSMTRILYYRLLGARVGSNVAIGTVNITDPLLTRLEDFSTLGDGSTLAAHTITLDRFMVRRVHVGRGATVGIGSVVMPGVVIGDNAVIAALSRVNPGMTVPPSELWDGIPAVKIKAIQPWAQKSADPPE